MTANDADSGRPEFDGQAWRDPPEPDATGRRGVDGGSRATIR